MHKEQEQETAVVAKTMEDHRRQKKSVRQGKRSANKRMVAPVSSRGSVKERAKAKDKVKVRDSVKVGVMVVAQEEAMAR